MSNIAKELGLVSPRYRRPWALYVHGLGLYERFESREEGEKVARNLHAHTKGAWVTFGPIFEPNTEVYDLTFGALRKDAPQVKKFKPL